MVVGYIGGGVRGGESIGRGELGINGCWVGNFLLVNVL